MDREERQTAGCARCGTICRVVGPSPRVDYPLAVLTAATTPRGLCADCAAHWWLFSVDGLRWGLQDFGPWVLSLPPVQQSLGRILGKMHAELGACDWNGMIARWDLPWPTDWALPCEGRNG